MKPKTTVRQLDLYWRNSTPELGDHWQCFRCLHHVPPDKRTVLTIEGQGTAPLCRECGHQILVCLEHGTSAPIAFPQGKPIDQQVYEETRAAVLAAFSKE